MLHNASAGAGATLVRCKNGNSLLVTYHDPDILRRPVRGIDSPYQTPDGDMV